MITTLRLIKGHDKVESLQIMLEVIEVLEKNCQGDGSMSHDEWVIMKKWLEKYYCELKTMFIKERGY